jgi:hypothetical protein
MSVMRPTRGWALPNACDQVAHYLGRSITEAIAAYLTERERWVGTIGTRQPP